MRTLRLFHRNYVAMLLLIALGGCAPTPADVPATSSATMVILAAASTIQPTETSIPIETPTPNQKSIMAAKLGQIVTMEDVAELSEDLGIMLWTLDEEFVGEYRVCRTFYGQSWSINRNLAANCIWQMLPGITFDETLDWLKSINALPASAANLESAYDYADDFGLYGYLGSNGHSVYDAFLLKDGFLYWAEIDVGTPGGLSPTSLFTSKYGGPVDTFVHDVLMINLARGR